MCVCTRYVGDRGDTANDSHVRRLLYETSDLINRSEEDARRQPEGHHSSLRSVANTHTHTQASKQGEGIARGTLPDSAVRQQRRGQRGVEAHSNRKRELDRWERLKESRVSSMQLSRARRPGRGVKAASHRGGGGIDRPWRR